MDKVSTLCIIDDDPIYTFVLGDMLRSLGLADNISIYDNGLEAILRLKEANCNLESSLPNVIFLDLEMPIMDGWQFLDEFAKVSWRVPIKVLVLSSTKDAKEIRMLNEINHVSEFIQKPISEEMLLDLDIFNEFNLKNSN